MPNTLQEIIDFINTRYTEKKGKGRFLKDANEIIDAKRYLSEIHEATPNANVLQDKKLFWGLVSQLSKSLFRQDRQNRRLKYLLEYPQSFFVCSNPFTKKDALLNKIKKNGSDNACLKDAIEANDLAASWVLLDILELESKYHQEHVTETNSFSLGKQLLEMNYENFTSYYPLHYQHVHSREFYIGQDPFFATDNLPNFNENHWQLINQSQSPLYVMLFLKEYLFISNSNRYLGGKSIVKKIQEVLPEFQPNETLLFESISNASHTQIQNLRDNLIYLVTHKEKLTEARISNISDLMGALIVDTPAPPVKSNWDSFMSMWQKEPTTTANAAVTNSHTAEADSLLGDNAL